MKSIHSGSLVATPPQMVRVGAHFPKKRFETKRRPRPSFEQTRAGRCNLLHEAWPRVVSLMVSYTPLLQGGAGSRSTLYFAHSRCLGGPLNLRRHAKLSRRECSHNSSVAPQILEFRIHDQTLFRVSSTARLPSDAVVHVVDPVSDDVVDRRNDAARIACL